jgi:hypothetical protein
MAILKTDQGAARPADDHIESVAESVSATERRYRELLGRVEVMARQLSDVTIREAQLRAVLERDGELEADYPKLLSFLERTTIPGHIAGAIERADLRTQPCPYTVIETLLPPYLYKCLLRGIPPIELFTDRPANKQHLDIPFTLAPTYSQRVWRYMAEVVVQEMIAPCLIGKFRAHIDEWITRNWPDVPPESVELKGTGGRIMRRQRGYRIHPHRDPKWSFITCIFYLARSHDSQSWGTQLYAVEDDREATSAAPYWIDESRCREVENVGFVANRLLAFLNSDGAHGAFIPEDAEPDTLERYIYQFRIAPTAESIAMLKSQLPEERRPLWAGKALVDY